MPDVLKAKSTRHKYDGHVRSFFFLCVKMNKLVLPHMSEAFLLSYSNIIKTLYHLKR